MSNYFYIEDEEFGPLFLKVCSYAPWSIKLCLNGNEWAERQLNKRGIGYEALDNGFLSCSEPANLEEICDQGRARLPHQGDVSRSKRF